MKETKSVSINQSISFQLSKGTTPVGHENASYNVGP